MLGLNRLREFLVAALDMGPGTDDLRTAAVEIFYSGSATKLRVPVGQDEPREILLSYDRQENQPTALLEALKLFGIEAQPKIMDGQYVSIPIAKPGPLAQTAEYKKMQEIGAFLLGQFFNIGRDGQLIHQRQKIFGESRAIINVVSTFFEPPFEPSYALFCLGNTEYIEFDRKVAAFIREHQRPDMGKVFANPNVFAPPA